MANPEARAREVLAQHIPQTRQTTTAVVLRDPELHGLTVDQIQISAGDAIRAMLAFAALTPPTGEERPIDMLLFCPKCGLQHVDEPEDGFHEGEDANSGAWDAGWSNPPHRSHLCHACGCIWRPADVPTNGVAAISTVGKADTWGESNCAALATPPRRPALDREAVLNEAVEPWKGFHGDLPDYDHPLRCVFESGVQYTVELLAKELGVEDYEPCDGTEEFDGDLGGTLINIVKGALPTDQHGDHYHPSEIAALLPAEPVQEMREGEK